MDWCGLPNCHSVSHGCHFLAVSKTSLVRGRGGVTSRGHRCIRDQRSRFGALRKLSRFDMRCSMLCPMSFVKVWGF